MKSNEFRKWIAFIFFDLMVLFVIIFSVIQFRPFSSSALKIEGVWMDSPKNLAEFTLTDHHGHPFTKNELKDHWTFVFFGFTHCPTVCPMTFDRMKQLYSTLQKKLPEDKLPQIVFISIDPERDTVSRLKQFVSAYHSKFIGVRTDEKKLKSLEKQFSVSISRENGKIDHSTDILLINPRAQIQAYFLYPQNPSILARDYEKIVGNEFK